MSDNSLVLVLQIQRLLGYMAADMALHFHQTTHVTPSVLQHFDPHQDQQTVIFIHLDWIQCSIQRWTVDSHLLEGVPFTHQDPWIVITMDTSYWG